MDRSSQWARCTALRQRGGLAVLVAATCAMGLQALLGAQQADFGTELFTRDPWRVRLDASADPATTVIDHTDTTIRVTTKAGATIWRPLDRVAGAFTVRATVRMAPGGNDGGAGLFFGGYDLDGIERNYATCLVRPDGSWSIAHRNGIELHNFRPWARAAAVSTVVRDAVTSNLVEWVVGASRVSCRINDVEMYSFPRARSIALRGGLRSVDGDVGIRVDAGLTATFSSLEITSASVSGER